MKVEKNILIAFLLNIIFSIIEIIGGLLTNSVAIMSDAIHDFGDALSIGISFFLEKKSNNKPNDEYTYGYARYSILGAFITTFILTIASIIVICGAIKRLFNPVPINYNGMIILAIFGVVINFWAAYFTKGGDSLNQKSVNLHMLEDVLNWGVVLIGSIMMKFTNITYIDSIMSLGVAIFILINALKNLKSILNLFLEKTPDNISIIELKEHLLKIKGIKDVHHIHLWSMDGINNYATLHVVTKDDSKKNIKNIIRKEFLEHGISHVTIEVERENEECSEVTCQIKTSKNPVHHHHH